MKKYALVLQSNREVIHFFDTVDEAKDYCTNNNSSGWLIVKVLYHATQKPVELVKMETFEERLDDLVDWLLGRPSGQQPVEIVRAVGKKSYVIKQLLAARAEAVRAAFDELRATPKDSWYGTMDEIISRLEATDKLNKEGGE